MYHRILEEYRRLRQSTKMHNTRGIDKAQREFRMLVGSLRIPETYVFEC